MPLYAILPSLDDVPEALHPYYLKKDDQFILQIADVDNHPDVTSLKNAYQSEKTKRQTKADELDAVNARLAGLPADFDPEIWRRAKEGKADPAELLQIRQTLEAERDQWKTKAEDGDRKVYELTVERQLDAHLAEHGVTEPVYLEAARTMLKPQIKVNEAGNPVVDTDMGPLALSEYVQRWVTGKGKAFVSQPKGGGAGGSGGQSGHKKLSEMNDAERRELQTKDPQRFKTLVDEAKQRK